VSYFFPSIFNGCQALAAAPYDTLTTSVGICTYIFRGLIRGCSPEITQAPRFESAINSRASKTGRAIFQPTTRLRFPAFRGPSGKEAGRYYVTVNAYRGLFVPA